MRILVQKPKANPRSSFAEVSMPFRGHVGQSGQNRQFGSISQLQDTIGTQAVHQGTEARAEEPSAGLTGSTSPRFEHDFGQISIYDRTAGSLTVGALQAKLTVSKPGDQYEQDADRVSEQVMRMEAPGIAHSAMPAIQRLGRGAREGSATKPLHHLCPECENEEAFQRKAALTGADAHEGQAPRQTEAKVHAVSGGRPLTNEQRAFFEPRFGVDFSRVRIHTDGSADTAARAVGALAFTRRGDIVFRGGQYHPHAYAGQRLLAHELAHVVQQGAAPRIRHGSVNDIHEPHFQSSELHMGTGDHVVQRWPGDGMVPPGDCSWANYLVLRGSVETAKAVVGTLGACSAGDNCLTLAAKIAAITAEIAARVALDATCYRGGDTGHRQQVQDKINMMNRCYRFFSNSNCSPSLIAAMAVVVERAREVIAAASAAVAIALAVAIIAAIIALAEVIAALVAAAAAATAEAAVAAAAAAAVIALLVLIKDELA